MNYNDLLNKLDNYNIKTEKIGEDTIIYVYPKNNDGSANLDVGIKLKNSNGYQIWDLYEIQRNKDYKLGDFSIKDIAFLGLYITVKGKFEKIKGNNHVKSELRTVEKNIVDGKEILQKNINELYFSLKHEKEGAINLIEGNQAFDVFYLTHQKEKIVFTEARPLSSALVVLYNFSIKLEKFDELFKLFTESLELEELEKMKKIYISN
ncbi:hypothetical protein [Metabacillus halosaccharovorans]|uniref:hypothetical protein n=1 Tax=Metabacillus halosaccharovorans TaxID=930124 RepID=UPI001C1FB56F|nr:hypothetical protein [Metabacillus halosaccharovorans]MBU7591738.1 hypothetical protein [Metabacillus halosaccharovorans]